jgi:hypothetical protein
MGAAEPEDMLPKVEAAPDPAPEPQAEEPTAMPDPAPPVSDGNDVFPIPCRRFIQTLTHTPHEVWKKTLLVLHGRENHTPDEWWALISDHGEKPAHPHGM